MHASDLPLDIRGAPFAIHEALGAGVSRSRLRATDLRTPHPGVRAPRSAQPTTLVERCAELLPRLAGLQIFCGATAVRLWGAPLPFWADASLHIGALMATREPRIPGVIGHRLTLPPSEVTLLRGLPVPHPAEAWAQLGAMARADRPTGSQRRSAGRRPTLRSAGPLLTLDDLVAVGDHFLTHELATAAELRVVAEVARRRGAVTLRGACDLIRAGAESPKETELRLILVRGGMPEPEVNWNLLGEASEFLARLDLAYVAYRVAVEYDGRQHAELGQFARDADRWAAIEASGWLLVRVLSHHLKDPGRLILPRVARALRSRGWSPGA